MQHLLKKLYEKIIIDPIKYPLSFIEDHLDRIEQILHPEYKNGKILWYILECYQEIIANLPDEDNIRTILKRKPITDPIMSKFKGDKLIKKEKITVVNVNTDYTRKKFVKTARDVQVPTNDKNKSRSPLRSRTPTKTTTKKPKFADIGGFSRINN